MRKRIQAWLRGPIIAIGSMALYAIALGCFLALMLLVISMEEGGENLSSSTLDMTRIVVLLSQGIGFETDSLSLSIMPLLLTVLLIGLVVQPEDMHGYPRIRQRRGGLDFHQRHGHAVTSRRIA